MDVDRSATAAPAAAPGDLTGLVGKHLIYAYENGWKYELYVRDSVTVSFRCLIGPMFGRWSTHQRAKIVQLDGDMYKLAWVEPTGTTTVVIAWLSELRVHTTICYPQWMLDFPEITLGRYEDDLDAIVAARDAGPTYPLTLVASTGLITFLESRPADDDTVIDCSPSKLPVDYANRTG
ncbi:phenolic acid decarboxylase [Nocardia sp. NBC_01503]|uniref:phenolic acid decarboxylase n=1 Tax=Nocardia sp. NBC_01503 TaxID=2975997 RepID=UPI002E7C3373|nr:phenolic acid decarboxylase [Nocardia sp. NBC_01503]WTL33426.1 phenolic acid decarboxylase [Nocardia sp. NBC_01503]